MEDQKVLKAFIDESIHTTVQEVKDSFAKDLMEMRDILMEVVANTDPTGNNCRGATMELARQEKTYIRKVEFGRFLWRKPEAWIFQAER